MYRYSILAASVCVSEAVLAVLLPLTQLDGCVRDVGLVQSHQQLLSLQAGQAKLAEVAELKVVVAGLHQQLNMDKAYPPLQSNQSHDLKLDVRCAVHTELGDKDKRARRCVGSSTSRRYV